MRDLRPLLMEATYKQLEPLVQILNTSHCYGPYPEDIVRGIHWLHRNFFQSFWRDVLTDEEEDYADVLHTLLERIGCDARPERNVIALEGHLVASLFSTMWDGLSEEKQSRLESALEDVMKDSEKNFEWMKIGGVGGAIALAQMGGFSTYVLASSTLSSLSSALGVTLPFGIYTSLSSAISVAIGPVGWAGLAIYATYKLTGTNFEKLIPAALYIAMLRQELAIRPNQRINGMIVPYGYKAKRGVRLL